MRKSFNWFGAFNVIFSLLLLTMMWSKNHFIVVVIVVLVVALFLFCFFALVVFVSLVFDLSVVQFLSEREKAKKISHQMANLKLYKYCTHAHTCKLTNNSLCCFRRSYYIPSVIQIFSHFLLVGFWLKKIWWCCDTRPINENIKKGEGKPTNKNEISILCTVVRLRRAFTQIQSDIHAEWTRACRAHSLTHNYQYMHNFYNSCLPKILLLLLFIHFKYSTAHKCEPKMVYNHKTKWWKTEYSGKKKMNKTICKITALNNGGGRNGLADLVWKIEK